MAGVAPHILLTQGHKTALGSRAIIGPLGEFATPTEIATREAMDDIFMESHNISRHCFTVFQFGGLDRRVLRVIEVMDDGDGGHITVVFEIDHRRALAERCRPGGFDLGEDIFADLVLVLHSVTRGKTSSCHCYTFGLPEKTQLLTDYNEWASIQRSQGVTVDSFVAGWRGALSIAKRLDKVVATDTLPQCILCNGEKRRSF